MSLDRIASRHRTPSAEAAGAFASAPLARRRRVSDDESAPPLAALGEARVATQRRVALARSERGTATLPALLRELATAAGARIVWSECVGEAGGALTRALADCDAVVADRAPCLRVGERALLPRFHSVVRAPSAFGSGLGLHATRRPDLLLVGAVRAGAAAWEESVGLAARWARAEGRRSLHCAVRDAAWPILPSDRAARFRRVLLEHGPLAARQVGHEDTRRRLLLEPRTFEAIVADARDVDGLARAACAGVGWSNAVPSIFVGDGRALVVLGDGAATQRGVESGETALAVARATERLLRTVGETGAAARLADAIAAELGARLEAAGDLWLDLASETPGRVVAAIAARLRASEARAS